MYATAKQALKSGWENANMSATKMGVATVAGAGVGGVTGAYADNGSVGGAVGGALAGAALGAGAYTGYGAISHMMGKSGYKVGKMTDSATGGLSLSPTKTLGNADGSLDYTPTPVPKVPNVPNWGTSNNTGNSIDYTSGNVAAMANRTPSANWNNAGPTNGINYTR